MHIPDGMLDTRTWGTAWLGSAGAIGYAVRYVRTRVDEGRVVLMAVLAALVFALQMLNFPVAGGTSGHFAGGAATAIVLGPWPAVLVMSTVLTVQALVFADGGIAALGANILNMGIVAPFAGWLVYSLFARLGRSRRAKLAGAFVAAWFATVSAAMATALEIWLSGRAPLPLVVGSMGFWHALIGIGEGVITAGLVGYLLAVRPDLLSAEDKASEPTAARRAAIGLGVTALAAAALSFAASAYPDGLEYVAERTGFTPAEGAPTAFARSPLPDYLVPGIGNETLASVLAGVVGLALTGVALYGLVRAARLRRGQAKRS